MPIPRPLLLALSLAIVSIAASAQAEPKVHDMDPIKIVIKPSRPLVTEIANPPKNLASDASKQPVASKIESAVTSSPF
jgi:hypothetical protein